MNFIIAGYANLKIKTKNPLEAVEKAETLDTEDELIILNTSENLHLILDILKLVYGSTMHFLYHCKVKDPILGDNYRTPYPTLIEQLERDGSFYHETFRKADKQVQRWVVNHLDHLDYIPEPKDLVKMVLKAYGKK
jgi:hypothetical protein